MTKPHLQCSADHPCPVEFQIDKVFFKAPGSFAMCYTICLPSSHVMFFSQLLIELPFLTKEILKVSFVH